jgi:hypothetical protein
MLDHFKAILGLQGAVNVASRSALSAEAGPIKFCDDPKSLAVVGESLKQMCDQNTSYTYKRGKKIGIKYLMLKMFGFLICNFLHFLYRT